MTIATIHTDLLFDPRRKAFVHDNSFTVDSETGLIKDVYQRTKPLQKNVAPPDIDLRGKTVLPGLVDAHTHIFLHPYSEASSLHQERDESQIERVIRATNHCRAALLAGFTTYRELGTEGLLSADIHFRDAVNRGLTPGPRLLVATECIASTGGYEIRQENGMPGGTSMPRLSDPADGIAGVRAAVRRRLGAGADIVKFYADYRKRPLRFPPPATPRGPDVRFPPRNRNPALLLFTQQEMNTMVEEGRAAKCPVVAHAITADAMRMASDAGVTSVEHGNEGEEDEEVLRTMLKNGTIFVPTLAIMEVEYPKEDFRKRLPRVKHAWDMGIKLACGGDTGGGPAHGDSARELELMLDSGIPLDDVLCAATLHGWEACGRDWCGRNFGWIGQGTAADVVALAGDLRKDRGALRKVDFVMKDGMVWKRDGVPRGMT